MSSERTYRRVNNFIQAAKGMCKKSTRCLINAKQSRVNYPHKTRKTHCFRYYDRTFYAPLRSQGIRQVFK